MAMPAAQNAVLGAVAPAEIGKASGTFNMLRFLGGAFGVAILGAVFARAEMPFQRLLSGEFVPTIAVAAILSLLGAVVGLALPRRSRMAPEQVKAEA